MVITKRALFAATLAVTVGFAGSALAQGKKDQAPGQTTFNPGQTFKTQRDNPAAITPALPPGQLNKLDPGASPPGEGVQNFGRTKKVVPGE